MLAATMAERSREKSGRPPQAASVAGPPSSERTQMWVAPDETQQPADEGTLMMSPADMPPSPRKGPNPALLQTQLMRDPAQFGVRPGSQPGPGFRAPQNALMGPPQAAPQGAPDPRLVLITEPDSARAASFRLLRDNLLAKRLPRVLAVSSAAKKDGKTICALNLALSLAERAKVLLVDGNILDPELDKIFGISEATPLWPMNAAWLAPYRIAEVSRGLHVAAMVTPYGQPAPRFDKTWFDQVIGSLRRFPYDFIIIDAAALSASPTVSQMVAAADATLLAVRSGVTTARVLRRATDQIPEGRAIGIALIDATVRP